MSLTTTPHPVAVSPPDREPEPDRAVSRPEATALAWLAVVAFGIRVLAIALLVGLVTPPELGSDSEEYDVYAWNVARGLGYRGLSPDVSDPAHLTAYRPPTTPLFYAAIYRLFGHSYAAAHLGDCLLSALSVLLLFDATRRCFDRRAAWLAALAFALYPLSIYYNVQLLSETSGAFLALVFLCCALRIPDRRGLGWSVAAGLSYGGLLLCKPGFVLLVPLLPVWAWTIGRRDWRVWARVAVLAAVAGAVMTPWIVRNYQVFGRLIPFSTMGGMMMLASNNRLLVEDPNLFGYCVMDNAMPETAGPLKAVDDELLRDDTAKRLAREWLRANPDKWFYMVRGKFLRLWLPWGASGGRLTRLAVYGPYCLALLGALLTVVPATASFVRRRHPGTLIALMIVASTGLALVFFGMHRYRFPIDSMLILLAAGGLVTAWDAARDGTLAGWPGRVRDTLAAHRVATLAAVAVAGVLGVASVLDNRQIERFRDRLCEERMTAVAEAVARYAARTGALPTDLGALVPADLPNLQPLHCPKHSLTWHQYNSHLRSTDARRTPEAISYRLEAAGPDGSEPRVTETAAAHFGAANSVRIPRTPRFAAEPAVPPAMPLPPIGSSPR